MPIVGSIDRANNAPKYWVDDKSQTGTTLYGNTTGPEGVFGVDNTETTVSGGKVTHAGWVRRVRGYGALSTVEINDGGDAYANTDTWVVASVAGANAEGGVVTDGNGLITAVTISNYGTMLYGDETVTITTSTGSGADLSPTFSGRAGRVTLETLVAFGSMSSDGSDDTIFPDS